MNIRVAVPSVNPGGLEAERAGHFGHCDVFTIVDIEDGEIKNTSIVENVSHAQGGCMVPVNLLSQQNANALIVGGIGMRPFLGFRQVGIEVYYSPNSENVGAVVDDLIKGRLQIITEQQTCGGQRR
ncbi:MAG: NifB/NifX family molybdenum-iron cluster-binding protein [Deltaproteobacteria bacterium]|nr:NifB/NifX family molybdenum-iron cluster-binding protein [Deltaproteobacteria bacterium]